MFGSIFAEISWKLLFLSKILIPQKESKKYSEMIFFQQVRNGANPEENFDLMETSFFGQSSEMEQLLTNILPSQNEPHTVKLSFSDIWSIFAEIDWKPLFLQKSVCLGIKLRIFSKDIFLNKFDEANTEQKFWFNGNNFFWANQWNWTNIDKNGFPPQNELHIAKYS